jgi:hypothetical protein
MARIFLEIIENRNNEFHKYKVYLHKRTNIVCRGMATPLAFSQAIA